QENTMFNEIMFSFVDKYRKPELILGAYCNNVTHRLEWMDGSSITYTKNIDLDCVPSDLRVVSNAFEIEWQTWSSMYKGYWNLMCVAEPIVPLEAECADYEEIEKPTDEDKPC
ncbi:hypothetical protein PFISCL1PPCAC_17787, partial [Pristionchus fissidentatus]